MQMLVNMKIATDDCCNICSTAYLKPVWTGFRRNRWRHGTQTIGYGLIAARIGYRRDQNKKPQTFVAYGFPNTPGRIRTCDHRFRKPVLYPLSYEGKVA